MKNILFTISFLFSISTFGQSIKKYEQILNDLIEKRNHWYEVLTKEYEEKYLDSLDKYNVEFEKELLKTTNKISETLECDFNLLKKNVNILTSKDGNFRIYTWNTLSGGTMQFYRNIFQYKVDGKVYSKINNIDLEDNGCSFYEINEIVSKNKTYYITSSINVGSSAVYYYEAKIFSVENGKLNENVKLIKTKTGINNMIGYEIDFSSKLNRNKNNIREFVNLEFDKKNNVIIIPLITVEGKIRRKKIRYKFKNEYFEKL